MSQYLSRCRLDLTTTTFVDNGLIFAGSNAGKSDRLRPVADLMQELVSDAMA
ncbi:hypothetical protein [Halomicronema sp. CCY15110]|uniref:hypothetical protein n=1 Tax=Halomicronema sp. CCY15110 TaxID=2767773 RepID=UPI00194E8BB5|nr:hypothetical protein [Halomicronema sp. CCY15110]